MLLVQFSLDERVLDLANEGSRTPANTARQAIITKSSIALKAARGLSLND